MNLCNYNLHEKTAPWVTPLRIQFKQITHEMIDQGVSLRASGFVKGMTFGACGGTPFRSMGWWAAVREDDGFYELFSTEYFFEWPTDHGSRLYVRFPPTLIRASFLPHFPPPTGHIHYDGIAPG